VAGTFSKAAHTASPPFFGCWSFEDADPQARSGDEGGAWFAAFDPDYHIVTADRRRPACGLGESWRARAPMVAIIQPPIRSCRNEMVWHSWSWPTSQTPR
jgi:hypothetical protein